MITARYLSKRVVFLSYLTFSVGSRGNNWSGKRCYHPLLKNGFKSAPARGEAFSSHVGLTCVLVLMPLSGVCPVSFFGMLRKGHLLPGSPGALDSFQHRVRTDFQSPSSLGVLGYYLLEWNHSVKGNGCPSSLPSHPLVPPLSCYSNYPGSVLYFTGIPGLTSLFVSQFTRSASKNFYLPYVFLETSLCTWLPGPASLRWCKPFFP